MGVAAALHRISAPQAAEVKVEAARAASVVGSASVQVQSICSMAGSPRLESWQAMSQTQALPVVAEDWMGEMSADRLGLDLALTDQVEMSRRRDRVHLTCRERQKLSEAETDHARHLD